jgi:hypothetical protein
LLLAGCQPSARKGMVVDPETGLQFGSVVTGSLTMDPSLLKDRRLKIKLRNTSGDPAVDLSEFQKVLEEAYAAQGYKIVQQGDFGVLLDVNVIYSGQATQSMALEYGLLGVGGGLATGYYATGEAPGRDVNTAIGAMSGAGVGAILGSYVTDETFAAVSMISIAIPRSKKEARRSDIYFSESRRRIKKQERRVLRQYRYKYDLQAAVYAGGENISQSDIAAAVRKRLYRIAANIM